jgi:glutathione S-transferase
MLLQRFQRYYSYASHFYALPDHGKGCVSFKKVNVEFVTVSVDIWRSLHSKFSTGLRAYNPSNKIIVLGKVLWNSEFITTWLKRL